MLRSSLVRLVRPPSTAVRVPVGLVLSRNMATGECSCSFVNFKQGTDGQGGHNSNNTEERSTQQSRQRTSKWATSYARMTVPEAEERLGFRMDEMEEVAVDKVLADSPRVSNALKEKVYVHIVDYIEFEGYPTEASAGFKEAKVSDLVLYTIGLILVDFRRRTGHKIRLEREKVIISPEHKTGGIEGFVVMDRVSVTKQQAVLIVEGKRGLVGKAMRQCLLSLKDARDRNGGGDSIWLRYDRRTLANDPV